MILEDMMNHLADMPGLDLPIYLMAIPADRVECIALFIGASGGVGSRIGYVPAGYTSPNGGVPNHMDYPGVQIHVRRYNPLDAFKTCEDIRKWLDYNPPTGYLRCDAKMSAPVELTSKDDLAMVDGPSYRFCTDLALIKER